MESPTTAKPIDMDDEEGDASSTAQPHPTRTSSARAVHFKDSEETPPAKPPRPTSPNTQAIDTLSEAFPTTEKSVIRAVLLASGGKIEPAFNALLSMSDPDFQGDEAPPPQPPRPTQQQRQLEQDELYARQLAEHYATANPNPNPRRQQGERAQPRPNAPQGAEREYSFFDDDLPEIRENLRQGFLSTQRNINKWVTDFRKRIDGEDDDSSASADPRSHPSTNMANYPNNPYPDPTGRPDRFNFGAKQSDQLRGIQRNADRMRQQPRGSGEYDADPRVLSDNFTELELHDAESEERPPPKPARPLANPDLFKPTPSLPGEAGRTSAQESGTVPKGPVDEVDALYGEPTLGAKATTPTPASGGKSKKWQPLTSVAPAPAGEDDDPFRIDDDDEDKGEDVAKEATERLKRASASKEAGETADGKTMEESEKGTGGLRNKAAEELLAGEKK